MKTKITVIQGDITKLKVDVIVNAANKTLLGGGGVDGAIHRAAGSGLLEECKTLGGCETGDTKVTKAYNLQAKYIVHTVASVYGKEGGHERELLSSCYTKSMEIADQLGAKSIAFPCIGAGAFHYPHNEAAKIAIETVKRYLVENETGLEEVIFVTFSEIDYILYKQYEL